MPKPAHRYFRNKRGEVVHDSACPYKGTHAVPWRIVAGMTDEEVEALVSRTWWLRFCRHCMPRRT
jgi:hypothetical protein